MYGGFVKRGMNGRLRFAVEQGRIKKCGCPICSNHKLLTGYNDVRSNEELLKNWDYERNEVSPKNVCIGTAKQFYWKCHECGYQWKDKVISQRSGKGCPCCNKRSALRQYKRRI